MKNIEVERHIQAPVERVFEVFTDLHDAPKHMKGIDKVELLTDGPIGKGTRWRETRTMFGREATEEMWITEFEPPRSYTVEAESHGAHYRTVFSFRPEADGTVAIMRFGAEPVSLVAKLMTFLFSHAMASTAKKALEKDMDDIKASCEDAGGQPSS